MSFARNFGNKYGKKLMNTAIEAGTNFNSKYGKKLTDTAIKAGKDFATIAGKKIVHKSVEATGVQRTLQVHQKKHIMKMKLLMKYQKKDIFLLKKDKKLLMN